ncbi:MAG TPA: TetR/AcrR family transcriptional regulator [Pirellulales bacterium]|nr:TetR/AcrR family transcriptional regulator [Pirellulales bacterium]
MQGTLTRKQREIQEREGKILELARAMIVGQGYHGLSMDRIAEALEYSKGTIYQHFSCKEEVLMALVNQALERRLGLFRRAAMFRGRPRERLVAIGVAAELFFRLYPDHFRVEHVIRLSSVQEKTSDERRTFLEACEASCMEIVAGVIRDGVASGDLKLPQSFGPECLAFGLWAITFGGNSIMASSPSLAKLGIQQPLEVIRANCNALLDGFAWRPLSSEIDQAKLLERIVTEVFPVEMAQAQLE